MAPAPARERLVMRRARIARSQDSAPNRASLTGSRATISSAGLTGPPRARSPRSWTGPSSAVTAAPPSVATPSAVRLAASPMTAAGRARRGITRLLPDGRAQALGGRAVEVAEDPRVVRGQQSLATPLVPRVEEPLRGPAQRPRLP